MHIHEALPLGSTVRITREFYSGDGRQYPVGSTGKLTQNGIGRATFPGLAHVDMDSPQGGIWIQRKCVEAA